jgi:hypothetical protein
VSALITVRATVLIPNRKKIADLAIRNRLPSMYEGNDFVEVGGADEVRVGDQSENREADRPQYSAECAGARGQSH